MSAADVPHELLTAAQASDRWPQFRFDGPVLHHGDAGTVDADATIAAAVRRVTELGARVLSGVRVTGADVLPGGRVVLRTGGPEGDGGTIVANTVVANTVVADTVVADTVVVAAGAWLPELAGHLGVPVDLPPLRITQQQVFHFRQRDPAAAWPVFVYKDRLQLFGLPSGSDGGSFPAVKVARHNDGIPTTASTRDGIVDPASRDTVATWVERNLPGLDPSPVAEASCLYTATPDEDFVLDRVGPVVVVSPCSGHGAKFAPLIGRMTADLALGRTEPHPRFALRRAMRAETPS
jgi:sarcosine oxidase